LFRTDIMQGPVAVHAVAKAHLPEIELVGSPCHPDRDPVPGIRCRRGRGEAVRVRREGVRARSTGPLIAKHRTSLLIAF